MKKLFLPLALLTLSSLHSMENGNESNDDIIGEPTKDDVHFFLGSMLELRPNLVEYLQNSYENNSQKKYKSSETLISEFSNEKNHNEKYKSVVYGKTAYYIANRDSFVHNVLDVKDSDSKNFTNKLEKSTAIFEHFKTDIYSCALIKEYLDTNHKGNQKKELSRLITTLSKDNNNSKK